MMNNTEILFFALGILFTLLVGGMIYLSTRIRLTWQAWSSGLIGGLLALFTIGWSLTSLVEGESRAAVVGLVLFGLPAVVLLVLASRVMKRGLTR